MSLCMAPLQKNFGFEVQGVDLAEPPGADRTAEPDDLWARPGAQVFRDNGYTLRRRDAIAADRARFKKRMTIYLRGKRHSLPHAMPQKRQQD